MALRYNERTGEFDEVPDDPRINCFTFVGNPIRYEDDVVTFEWEVQDAQRIFLNDIEIPVSSSSYSYPLSEAGLQNFVLRIENGGNQVSETKQIKVLKIPAFFIEQSTDKLRKGKGENCLVKWTILDAQSAKLVSDGEEHIPLSSERRFSPDDSQVYSFEVIGLDGNRVFKHEFRIDVFEEARVLFEVDKNITLPHVPIKLSWKVENATAVELVGFGNVAHSGEEIIDCDREKTFTLKVTDVFGTTEYNQRIRMYPLPLIRSILVPIPQINQTINVETHIERKSLYVSINANTSKIPNFKGINADIFVPSMGFHSLSFPLTAPWKQKIKEYKNIFKHIITNRSINTDSSVFVPKRDWWQAVVLHKNRLSKKITNTISSLWNK